MPQIVEYNGAHIEFPDGMEAGDIETAIKKNALSLPGKQSIRATIDNDTISKGAREASPGEGFSQQALNALSGAVRGAGSIGATLLTPVDAAARALGVQNDLIGRTDRRQAMDSALQGVGADPESLAYGAGKLGAEIAGTAGVGGALAKPLQVVSGLAARAGAGAIPALDTAATALTTGGFRAPGLSGLPQVLTRIGAGAATGGATAGLVNPDDAGVGALIGGALPAATMLAGRAGAALRSNSPAISPRLAETAAQSIDAGYIIPPNMVNPGFKNQVIESISGKQATQQLASTKNTQVTEGLVRKALGIADDVPLSQGTLEDLRKTAGKAYADVSSLSPQAASDLEALKVARNDATGWFTAYNRSARPDDLAKAKAARGLADQLERSLESAAKQAGRDELVPALRDARREIAKTYTVGRALNDASGTVDARVLGRMYEKGSPLSDELKTAGQFASAFPTIAKSPQQVGSPAAHNLKAIASALMGLGGSAAVGPIGAGLAAYPFIAPPLARAMMFSRAAQQGLLNTPITASEIGLLGRFSPRALPLLPEASRTGLLGMQAQ